ncbi:MAG: ATP-binding cassette domain-containing protein [Devosia nanyangense]|uniref:ATP-binding cassette domain-containing protein n=1 Tax=Devosia nanyangense TaxID=1228055 RepID=A0A933L593_9HYPH|nr:ATP-binding cassette domain-containing protein [Devosia nanyangense]
MAAITIRNLDKAYGKTRVLHGINLEIADNSFVVFVGPSGCGKSTLLRTIAGLEEKERGEILLDGRDISDEAPVDRDVAMVFQSYALYPQMTVAENIGFALSVAKQNKATIGKKVGQVAELLRLEDYLERKPSALSGGQRQRVAIGRAIVRDPKVFLFDEPLSNLDAELRVEMRLQIAQLRRRLGATFIYVTHDQVEAMTLADTIVVLRMGMIEQVGSPLELYHKPANQFVAGFIGSPKMNFIPAAAVSGLDLKGAATVGVRPEHLHIDEAGSLKGVVRTVEDLGSISYAYAALPDETLVTVTLPPEHSVVVDQPLALSIVPGRSYLFGADGKTIG